MKMTGADIVVRALEDEGIPFTFGIPGTHNIELYDSLARSTKVRPILVTDEQSASFMADGVARSSGNAGGGQRGAGRRADARALGHRGGLPGWHPHAGARAAASGATPARRINCTPSINWRSRVR